ncbi:MAG: hypothetical protein KAG66_17305, partial [Methylococcales bacterium]|nr:hypothetical protein [Methylococcales bacterium]
LGIQETLAKLKTSGGLFRYLIEHAESQNENQNRLEEIISKPGSRMLDLVWKHPNGRFLDFRIHLFDVTDAKGELMGRGHLWQDITSDKELDRMKSTLISTVSHELRTPLAAIKGYVSTLLAEDVVWNADDQRAFLQTINDETNRLTKLVKDLLDMSRIEAGNLPMYFDFHALTDLIPRGTDQMMANGNAHGRDRIHLNIPPDLPPVWVDAQRIETVMRNLLENASKYSPPDQPIEINALRRNDEIIIQVRDFGSGIPNALQTKIFERFYRADSSLSRKVGGVGLGLSICKGFVEAHGGKIWVKNQHPGAAFNFSLPTKEQT